MWFLDEGNDETHTGCEPNLTMTQVLTEINQSLDEESGEKDGKNIQF